MNAFRLLHSNFTVMVIYTAETKYNNSFFIHDHQNSGSCYITSGQKETWIPHNNFWYRKCFTICHWLLHFIGKFNVSTLSSTLSSSILRLSYKKYIVPHFPPSTHFCTPLSTSFILFSTFLLLFPSSPVSFFLLLLCESSLRAVCLSPLVILVAHLFHWVLILIDKNFLPSYPHCSQAV